MKKAEKAPRKRSVLKGTKAATVLEMIFSLMSIPLALEYITREYKGATNLLEQRVVIMMAFFVMALARLFRSRRMRLTGKPKAKYIMQLVYAGVFLVCSVLPAFIGYVKGPGLMMRFTGNVSEIATDYIGDVRQAVGILFWGILIVGRIASTVRDHRLRRVFVNVALIICMAVWCLTAFAICDLSGTMIVAVAMTIAGIMAVVFGRIHLDALAKIVRKTYALEIILGLLLLIVAFSYVLEACEDSIPTFEDGLWYCFAIVTTIGFGDFTATSLLGRILSVILGVYGIIVVALITSVIVNFYGEVRREPDDGPKDETEGNGTEVSRNGKGRLILKCTGDMITMHRNFLFDLDQTLLDFHASEYKALGIVLRENGLSFSDGIYRAFKAYNQSLWLELEKGTITRTELFTKRFLDVFSRCEGDASRLDPLKVRPGWIR